MPVKYIDRAGSGSSIGMFTLWLLNSLNFLSVVGNVAGSAHLHKRQGESLTDDMPAWLWDVTGLGAAVEATHWFLNDFVFPDVRPPPSNIPDTESTNRKDPQSKLRVEPDIELNTIAAPFGDECKPATSSGDQASIPGMSSDPCNIATAQIIYPFDCRTSGASMDVITAQCRAIEVALAGLVGESGYETIPRSCGVFFYTASLTPAQIKTLQELENPPEIGPDRLVDLLEDHVSGSVLAQHKSPQWEVKKRKMATDLISQADADPDLVFISQYPLLVKSSWSLSVPAYNYYNDLDVGSMQKRPVLVYVIDSGAVRNTKEFERENSNNGQTVKGNVIEDWIHASSKPGPLDEDDWHSQPGSNIAIGHGTCVTQKICGLKKGVHKNAHVIVVQLVRGGPLNSFMIALEKVADDLVMRSEERGEDIRGYILINISLGFQKIGKVNERQMLPLLQRLWNDFQAVIVAATGNDATNTDFAIARHPAAFSKRFKSPLIAVGGVDGVGHLVPRSRRGRGLTVTAPYLVTCTNELPYSSSSSSEHGDMKMSGTSFATALVSGVISAWLSDNELGAKLRRGDGDDGLRNLPLRVKALVMSLSYKRPGATVASIWNGVNAYQPKKWPPDVPRVF